MTRSVRHARQLWFSALVLILTCPLLACVRAGFDLPDRAADVTELGVTELGVAEFGITDGDPPGDASSGSDGAASGKWIKLLPGSFNMGSPKTEPCRDSDEDLHKVTLTHAVEVWSTEVTQEQFETRMGSNPSKDTGCGPNCPVEMVSWHQAAAYCNALTPVAVNRCYACSGSGTSVSCSVASAFAGAKIYTCPGYRLPTEAEWERAYRAGTSTSLHNGTPVSVKCTSCAKIGLLDDTAWYCDNTMSKTHPVARKKANAWGLFDMSGNVMEWCHDAYVEKLGLAAVIDPVSTSGTTRVIRGGHAGSTLFHLRAAFRDDDLVVFRHSLLGFRCARTSP